MLAMYSTNLKINIKNASVKLAFNNKNNIATYEAIEEGGYDELHYEKVIKCLLYNILHMQNNTTSATVIITVSNNSITLTRSS